VNGRGGRIAAWARVAGACGVLLLVGVVGRALRAHWELAPSPEAHPSRAAVARLGPGAALAVFGGLRQMIAHGAWIKGYARWEQRDAAGAEAAFALAVAADPREWYFWSNAVRIIAYDFPRWELRERDLAGHAPLAPEEEARLRARHGARALAWLDAAAAVFPDDPRVELERGMVRLHVLRDRRGAAEAFRAAAGKPGAPLFAARLYGELMRAEGERRLAYDWYRAWLASLPPELRAHQAPVILPRLRELEAELGLPDGVGEGSGGLAPLGGP
jgi:hypothetical protein